jgi:hypothetical protein
MAISVGLPAEAGSSRMIHSLNGYASLALRILAPHQTALSDAAEQHPLTSSTNHCAAAVWSTRPLAAM